MVLVGKELFLRSQYTDTLRASLEEVHGEIEIFQFSGEEVDPAMVLDECRSFGLMASHKLVIVDEADRFVKADTRPMLDRYAQNPSEQATLVLRGSKWNKGKLDGEIAKVGVILKCDTVDEHKAMDWIHWLCRTRHRCSIDSRAMRVLIDRLGCDLGRIDSELSKLATAAGEGGTITIELVAELVGLTREDDVWAIQSYLLCGDASEVLHELEVILNNSGKGVHVPVSFACCDLARKLMGIAQGMEQGINANVLAKEMKLWGPSRDPILHAARKIGAARARKLFDECVQADMALKSSVGTPMRVLEVLALSFVRLGR